MPSAGGSEPWQCKPGVVSAMGSAGTDEDGFWGGSLGNLCGSLPKHPNPSFSFPFDRH